MFMYNPPLDTPEDILAFRQVIHANQFPADPARCKRSLILFDDAMSAGLGYTARLLGRALLVAVNERRVLINAPHPTGRWCGRWPYTLACHYEPWTHCPLPKNLTDFGGVYSVPKWSHRMAFHNAPSAKGKGKAHAAPRAEVFDEVRISTSQIFKESFFFKFKQPPAGEASLYELLFRPRAWVREAARCVMREAGLQRSNFVTLHVRMSEEKSRERGRQMPPLSSYPAAAAVALAATNVSRVFLQTSTPSAVEAIEQWSAQRGVALSYTRSERSLHDLWMRRDANASGCVGNVTKKKLCATQAGERSSVVAQAVNALIASRARVFISPTASMWTFFVSALLRRRASDVVHGGHSSADKRLSEVHRMPNRTLRGKSAARGAGKQTEDAAGWTDF